MLQIAHQRLFGKPCPQDKGYPELAFLVVDGWDGRRFEDGEADQQLACRILVAIAMMEAEQYYRKQLPKDFFSDVRQLLAEHLPHDQFHGEITPEAVYRLWREDQQKLATMGHVPRMLS